MLDRLLALSTVDIQRKHGKALAFGTACDIVNACLDEKRALGKCSTGYAEACFDITSRLLDELRKFS